MANATLIKIDRNGSKHWKGMVTCDRCSGRGWFAIGVHNGQLVPSPVDNAVCYKCGGSGKVEGKWVERTPEYQAKLDAKRAEKAAKRAAEIVEQQIREREDNARTSLETLGIPEGKVYLFLDDVDMQTVDRLGGNYNPSVRFYIGHPVEGYELLEVPMADICEQDDWGRWHFTASNADINDMKAAELAKRHPSAWVGEVGQKISTTASYHHGAYFKVKSFRGFGEETMYVHTFTDPNGNQLVWKTGKGLPLCLGDQVTISGTIKELNEYKYQKQTVLTRCKVVKA